MFAAASLVAASAEAMKKEVIKGSSFLGEKEKHVSLLAYTPTCFLAKSAAAADG